MNLKISTRFQNFENNEVLDNIEIKDGKKKESQLNICTDQARL